MARQKDYTKGCVKEELKRLKKADETLSLAKQARNLNQLALEGKLDKVYCREDVLTAIKKVLLRKNKANVLLTGPAGCGKTAIAEALASMIAVSAIEWRVECEKAKAECTKDEYTGELIGYVEPTRPLFSDIIIYDLSLNSMLAGTQYRGQFEERLQKMLAECSQHDNVVLFIDEIHQINALGRCGEGEPTFGQILKPALARGDIRVIGATTTEESRILKQDKALSRRFTEVLVPQVVGEDAIKIADKVLQDYAGYHKMGMQNISPANLVHLVKTALPNSVFPNNIIDIIDETMAGARVDGYTEISMEHILATVARWEQVAKHNLQSQIGF